MNTAILFDEPALENEDRKNYEQLIEPMIGEWLPRFRHVRKSGKIDETVLSDLKNAAFMAWLAARGNIPVARHVIESFREIFLIVSKDLIEKPQAHEIGDEQRKQLEKSSMRLAKSIPVLELAINPEIRALASPAECRFLA